MIKAVIIFIIITFVYLIIYGITHNKSNEEKEQEDQIILKRAEKIKNEFYDKN